MKDAYSTDAKIAENDLVALEDDLKFFPRYQAVFLFRLSLPTSAIAALRKLEGTLDETRMIRAQCQSGTNQKLCARGQLVFRKQRSADNYRIFRP